MNLPRYSTTLPTTIFVWLLVLLSSVAFGMAAATQAHAYAIESLQDTAQFDSKSQNLSVSATVGFGASVSASFDQSKIKNDYASVQEQSGIMAGDDGFAIKVHGNTDLKGAVIASTQQAIDRNQNNLTTGTLTTSDIQNHADADASSFGVTASASTSTASDAKDGGKGQGPGGSNLMNVAQMSGGARNGVSPSAMAVSDRADSSTRSGISGAAIVIGDEQAQHAKTGQTAAQTVASLNRDTATANTVVQKQDVQEMATDVQIKQAFKQAVFVETVKFTDEAYRRMFVEKTVIYEVTKDRDGKLIKRPLSDEEKRNLVPGADGKIHIANNGIFNDADAASKYASQHGSADNGKQYLVYFPEANNTISELMIAGYQKFLEGDTLGLTNATTENKTIMEQYGKQGLSIDSHSRGAMTFGNALESLTNQGAAPGMLANTNAQFYGAAYNAEKADNLLGGLQNRDAVTDLVKKNEMVLQQQNHAYDPIGRFVGGNPSTGGTIPEGSNAVKEVINVFGGETTVHNCYGASPAACKELWQDSNNGQPKFAPVRIYPKLPTKE